MVKNIFPIPIYENVIEEDIFKDIKINTLNYIKNHPGLFSTPWSCPTKTTLFSTRSISIDGLNEQIKQSVNSYIKSWVKEPNTLAFSLHNLWINISEKYSYQESHVHLTPYYTTMFSGVIYIDVKPNSGDLILENPLTSHLLSSPQNLIPERIKITPKDGKIIIFPPWLSHSVTQNQIDYNRISISFNVSVSPLKPS